MALVDRKFPRISTTLPCAFTVAGENLAGVVKNLSEGGACIQTPSPPAEGTVLDLKFALPGDTSVRSQERIISPMPTLWQASDFVLTSRDGQAGLGSAGFNGKARLRIENYTQNPKLETQNPKRVLNLGLTTLLPLLLLLLTTGCDRKGGELKAGFEGGQYQTVVAFGDSIVEGYNQPEGWPEMLARDLGARFGGVEVINAGVAGNTAANGLARLQRDVLDRDPDLVLIAFGLNDMKDGESVAVFASNLASMVDGILAEGAQPVLLTTTRLQKGASILGRVDPAPFNEAIRKIASDRAIPIIDVNDRFRGYNTPEYLMDVAHPNQDGYRRLADIIRIGLVGE
ncbi:MAG: GDSL-type esterase/lipase family protein [bacterium]|nr:GDSL-type esterase/lipase family protein [bacterium]MDT8395602.1 GDSL-type esterase/lipase family protein [bacterium]